MARLWTCGFELNSLTSRMEVVIAAGSPTISTTTVRSGGFSLEVSGLGAGTAKGIRQTFVSAAADGAYFFRAYIRIAALPLIETTIFELNDVSNFATPIVRISLDATGALALFDEDGQIGSDSSALSTDTWYRIEIHFDRTGAAGAHIVRARIDGTEFAGASNRDLSGSILTFNFGANLLLELDVTTSLFFDDLAINDSLGSFQNSFPGEGEVIHLYPNAAGDNAGWTRGGSDSGANWDQVNEVPPNDITDYVQSNTLNTIDDYNIDATPSALESTDTINVLHVNMRVRVDDQTGADPDVVCRIKASASGTVEEGTTVNVNTTTWFTNIPGTGDMTPTLTLYDLPGASTTAWTKADLDSAQIGIRENETDTHNAQVSALWLTVDHKPGSAAPATRKFQRASVLGV